MSILIFFSFLFYAPVVIWSKTIPAIGALMIPKTVAYLLIVILGYKHYINAYMYRIVWYNSNIRK